MNDCVYSASKGIHCEAPTSTTPGSRTAEERAQSMREQLTAFLGRVEAGAWPLLPLSTPKPWVSRGAGHFHLASELFIQLAGWTDFDFPHTSLRLNAGEAILLPPRLLHLEKIGASDNGEAFCNLVVYAEGGGLRCHLASEAEPGVPGMEHLELRYHARAHQIHDWLIAASDLSGAGVPIADAPPGESTLGLRQARGLLAAATAGVLEVLDAPNPDSRAATEPPLVSRVRVFVQNQLGDHQLSVRRLAEQASCTPDYLSNVFSVATGEHLTAFINRQRIERAARLLRESALTSKEIAWACGFATQTYFIRTFRARMGVTPKAWKAASAAPAATAPPTSA